MKILVLVKHVPDTWGERKLDLTTGFADRSAGESVVDEVGERALEAALTAQEAHGGEVIVATMGPAGSEEALRKALAMGADAALHIVDDTLAGADLARTAQVLSALVQRESPDLVLAGNESTDGRGGVLPAMIAESVGRPHATHLSVIEVTPAAVSGTRSMEGGLLTVSAQLPAVASVTEQAPEPRFPTFRGIMKAKRKPLTRLTVADLSGVAGGDAVSAITSVTERPPRTAGTKITDEGDAGTKIADYLASKRII